MSDPKPPRLTKETLLRLAREQVGMPVADPDAMLVVVNDLQDEAAVVVRSPRAGVEPAPVFALEEWPHD